MVYSAADLYVICSVQDNLPNTVLEAMACGVPVVGVHVGGIPDMVRNDVNGLTVPVGDAEYLSKSISLILNNANLRAEMGSASRRIATDEYSLDLQARRYAELYQSLS
jgi:glycosyltransferase involved in cell wall biosynthesis